MPRHNDQLVLTAEEVAELLCISRAHVFRLHNSGRLPKPIRLGRAVRWPRRTLEAWLEAGAPPRDRWEEIERVGASTRRARS